MNSSGALQSSACAASLSSDSAPRLSTNGAPSSSCSAITSKVSDVVASTPVANLREQSPNVVTLLHAPVTPPVQSRLVPLNVGGRHRGIASPYVASKEGAYRPVVRLQSLPPLGRGVSAAVKTVARVAPSPQQSLPPQSLPPLLGARTNAASSTASTPARRVAPPLPLAARTRIATSGPSFASAQLSSSATLSSTSSSSVSSVSHQQLVAPPLPAAASTVTQTIASLSSAMASSVASSSVTSADVQSLLPLFSATFSSSAAAVATDANSVTVPVGTLGTTQVPPLLPVEAGSTSLQVVCSSVAGSQPTMPERKESSSPTELSGEFEKLDLSGVATVSLVVSSQSDPVASDSQWTTSLGTMDSSLDPFS
jgi:hypothetical protein